VPQTMSPAPAPVFLWQVEGLGVSIGISTDVLAKLHVLLDHTPPEQEFGGILLGGVSAVGDSFRTRVEAFEAFPIEHRHSACYTLSSRDERVLERRLQRLRRMGLVPVGICRSHLRRGLYLDQRDFEVFRSEFRNPTSLFLLVRPDRGGGARGAVFVWEEDDVRRHASYQEFPIEKPPEAVAEQILAAATATATRWRTEKGWQPLLAEPLHVRVLEPWHGPALLSWFGLDTIFRILRKGIRGLVAALRSAREVWSRARERAAAAGLALARALRTLATPAIAGKAVLTVALPLCAFLGARQIAIDRVHRSDAAPASEVQSVAASPRPLERQAAPAPEPKPNPFPEVSSGRAAPAPPPAGADPPAVRPAIERKSTLVSASRDRVDSEPEDSPAPDRPVRHPDATASRVPVLPDPPAVVASSRPAAALPHFAPPPPPEREAPDKVVAYFKPAPASSFRQAFEKVFTGHGAEDGFVAANPVERPLPVPAGAAPLEKGSSIEMLAKVDRYGNVVNVKMVEGNRQLADASADAILRWRFEPARRNGTPVESAMRIRFEFRGPSR